MKSPRRILGAAFVAILSLLATVTSPAQAGAYVPNTVTFGTETTASYDGCSFTFYYGNYGGGFGNIKLNGSSGCAYAGAYIVSANGGSYDDAYAPGTTSYGTYTQAYTPGYSIIYAEYCLDAASTGNVLRFSYNTLTNTLSSENTSSSVCPF